MYAIATDLADAVEGIDMKTLVVVEESPEFKGELVFQPFQNEQIFFELYQD